MYLGLLYKLLFELLERKTEKGRKKKRQTMSNCFKGLSLSSPIHHCKFQFDLARVLGRQVLQVS